MKKRILMILAALALLVSFGVTSSAPVMASDCGAGMMLAGNALPNVINGGPQNDEIHGGGGNDTLRGWGCNDRIFGGEGNDQINGGSGWDYCNGGPGFDVFVNCEVVVQ